MVEQKQAKRYYISGRVQGVGYRFFAQRVAEQLGLSGYAKNLMDGRVEVLAVGPLAQLDALRKELQRGPRHALVEGLDETDVAVLEIMGFSIEEY